MSETPTDRQGVVLTFVAEYHHMQQCPPTMREIGEHLAIRSTNGVNDHVNALIRKGYLEKRSDVARGIKLTDKGREYLASKATT